MGFPSYLTVPVKVSANMLLINMLVIKDNDIMLLIIIVITPDYS